MTAGLNCKKYISYRTIKLSGPKIKGYGHLIYDIWPTMYLQSTHFLSQPKLECIQVSPLESTKLISSGDHRLNCKRCHIHRIMNFEGVQNIYQLGTTGLKCKKYYTCRNIKQQGPTINGYDHLTGNIWPRPPTRLY